MKKEIGNGAAYLGDCLEVMKNIPDKSINLIVIDPPYNIGKDKNWDKWKTVNSYIEFMGSVFLECQRVLKDNGSFYFFHNDFLQIVELQNWLNKNSKFVFKQLIVWNKKFKQCSNEGFLQGFNEVEGLRNYQKMCEYCLYYTFQNETGLKSIYDRKDCFLRIKEYLRNERKKVAIKNNTNLSGANLILGELTGTSTMVNHFWGDSQWVFPTKENYENMKKTGFFQEEYETLRQEYESLRYTFNNQKTHHSVWNYEIAKKQGHITPKPVDLIENIIKHSSNEGDLILDCFSGSFTTAVACENTKRRWICIEKDETYFNIGCERIGN